MHNKRRLVLPIAIAGAAVAAGACDDPLASDRPYIMDTAEIRSIARTDPGQTGLPSAFDFSPTPAPISVVVESPGSGGWDIVLSEEDGELVLVPAGRVPGQGDAAITVDTDRAFDQIFEAPEAAAFDTVPVPVQAGAVYLVRTRPVSGCVFYAKVRPTDVNAADGLFRFEYVVNPNCNVRSLGPIVES